MKSKTYIAEIKQHILGLPESYIEMAIGNGLANAYIDCDYEVNKIEKTNYPICDIGDKIYAVVSDMDNGYITKEAEVYEISWNQNGMFYKTYPSLPGITQDKFGKTVFLTQSDAENKITELILKNEDYENEMV